MSTICVLCWNFQLDSWSTKLRAKSTAAVTYFFVFLFCFCGVGGVGEIKGYEGETRIGSVTSECWNSKGKTNQKSLEGCRMTDKMQAGQNFDQRWKHENALFPSHPAVSSALFRGYTYISTLLSAEELIEAEYSTALPCASLLIMRYGNAFYHIYVLLYFLESYVRHNLQKT